MRARYYNPTLKRFVNADIIVGSIDNSATLNRYAYANGNPVSNVDPFGLSAERGGSEAKVDFTRFIGNNIDIDFASLVQFAKYYWKYQETLALYKENQFKEGWLSWIFGTLNGSIKEDYKNNLKYDITSGYINNQNIETAPISKLKLMDTSMSFNGCEVIAVYNAMISMGYEASMANL